MTPAPGRALPLAAIVGLASPGCRVMFGAPLQLISDRTFSSTTLVIPDQQRDRPLLRELVHEFTEFGSIGDADFSAGTADVSLHRRQNRRRHRSEHVEAYTSVNT